MMKTTLQISALLILVFLVLNLNAQVAINTSGAVPDTKSMLDITSTTSGLLVPRMTQAQRIAIAPAAGSQYGLLVYQTDATAGYWYWNGTIWVRLYSGTGNAWDILGNSGTVAGTNFIGTTDAVDFVMKTGAGGIERARILSGGNILFNRTTALYATDLFEAQGNATFPDAINGYTDQATGTGVYGKNTSASGTGIIGTGNNIADSYLAGGSGGAFASSYVGVFGYGNNTAASYGVYGVTANATGTGVEGYNNVAAGGAVGFGGWFVSNQTGGAALVGTLGLNSYFAGSAVSGTTVSTLAGGIGVIGACNNATGTGVWGQSSGSGGDGVFGSASGATGFGTWGYNSNNVTPRVTGGTGVAGAGAGQTPNYLAQGTGGAFTGFAYGLYAKNVDFTFNQQAAIATYDGGGNQMLINAWSAGGTHYKVWASGAWTVSCSVPDLNNNLVTLHCPETPEFYFQDYGQGQLENGKTHIEIDPILAKNVVISEKHPLRVFVQLEGDCKGVYITNKTTTGFDVIELDGGTSNVIFQWSITCNVKDQEESGRINHLQDLRFEPGQVNLNQISQKTIEIKSIQSKLMKQEFANQSNILKTK